MTSLPDFLESGEIARLVPVIADSRREQRVTSVFLATLSAVPGFAEPLLSSVGVRLGKRSVIDTFTEVVISGHKEAKALYNAAKRVIENADSQEAAWIREGSVFGTKSHGLACQLNSHAGELLRLAVQDVDDLID